MKEKMEKTFDDVTQKVTGGSKAGAIVIAVIMIILGLLFIAWPFGTGLLMMAVATVGFVIFGIYKIVSYISAKGDERKGWDLASGIIFAIIGLLIMVETPAGMMVTFAFVLGFIAISGGINSIVVSSEIRKAGEKGGGWVMTSGIINLIIGGFFLFAPFGTWLVFDYVLGIFLMVAGAAFLIESLSGGGKNKPKAA